MPDSRHAAIGQDLYRLRENTLGLQNVEQHDRLHRIKLELTCFCCALAIVVRSASG